MSEPILQPFALVPERIPTSIRIEGGLINTSKPGNGVWFPTDDTETMVRDFEGEPFVANHDRGIADRAGTITSTSTTHFTHTVKDVEGEDIEEDALIGRFEAVLDNRWPAFEPVAGSIMTRIEEGEVPEVSVAVVAGGIEFDDHTNRIFLKGPFRPIHLGHVDKGAFKPSDHVGIDRVVVEEGAATLTLESWLSNTFDDAPATVHTAKTHLVVANFQDLARDFITMSDDPEAVAAVEEVLERCTNTSASCGIITEAGGEFACVLRDSGQFDDFRRKNNAGKVGKKPIDFVFGIKDGESALQAIKYRKEAGWTADEARSHCASRDGGFEGAESRGPNLADIPDNPPEEQTTMVKAPRSASTVTWSSTSDAVGAFRPPDLTPSSTVAEKVLNKDAAVVATTPFEDTQMAPDETVETDERPNPEESPSEERAFEEVPDSSETPETPNEDAAELKAELEELRSVVDLLRKERDEAEARSLHRRRTEVVDTYGLDEDDVPNLETLDDLERWEHSLSKVHTNSLKPKNTFDHEEDGVLRAEKLIGGGEEWHKKLRENIGVTV